MLYIKVYVKKFIFYKYTKWLEKCEIKINIFHIFYFFQMLYFHRKIDKINNENTCEEQWKSALPFYKNSVCISFMHFLRNSNLHCLGKKKKKTFRPFKLF